MCIRSNKPFILEQNEYKLLLEGWSENFNSVEEEKITERVKPAAVKLASTNVIAFFCIEINKSHQKVLISSYMI